MEQRPVRTLVLLSLLLGITVAGHAQDGAYKSKYRNQYKRFTMGDDRRPVDEAWGRREWFRERMGGDLTTDFARHLIGQAEAERAKYPGRFRSRLAPDLPAAVNGSQWVSLGPTSADYSQNSGTLTKVDSGRLRTILPDTGDTSGNTVYVLASGGGLWKTTNFLSAAPAWTALTDFVGSNLSGAAAFGRSTSTLFVGAGDPFDAGVGGFMIRSTDGGATWSPAFQLATSIIADIKVDTAGATDVVLVGSGNGLFRSADAGATYSAVASIPASVQVWSLARTSAGWLAAAEDWSTGAGSLYRSTDQGATWAVVAASTFSGAGRISLGVGAPGDAVAYAFAANTGGAAQLDLFRSTDGGLTWVALGITGKAPTNPNAETGTLDLMAGQAWYNHMILVDPSDAARNTVYLGGQLASAKTADGGATWTLLSNWLAQFGLPYVHADFHCAASSNIAGTPRLYFGSDGGLFTSTDGGLSWDDSKNKGLVNHLIYALAANPGVPGSALVGLQDNGTRIRSGTSSVFNQVRGGDGFGVGWAQDVTGAGAVSMSSYIYNSIERSTTSPVVDERNWTPFTSGLGNTGGADNSANYYFVTPLITPPAGVDPSGQVFFTYGRKTLFRSSSTGWTAIGTAGAGGIGPTRTFRPVSHGVGVSPTDLNHVAAAAGGGYLLITANGGASWSEVLLGPGPGAKVPGWQSYTANVAWATNSLLYACSEATAPGAVRVARSSDGGSTWSAAAGNLPDVPVTKLAVDVGDGTGNTVYAATWLGVYRTTNGGASWSLFGTGLPQGRATDLWVAPDSSSVRVSTWGRGVWELVSVPADGTVSITPSSGQFFTNATVQFTAVVNGGGTVTYGATGGTITGSGLYTAGSVAGAYTVTATNAANSAQKAVANFTLAVPAPVTFSSHPSSFTAAAGHTARFSVAASGSGLLTYQWMKGGVAIPGAIEAAYTTPALALGDSGAVYACVVTGAAGPATSNPATLTVMAVGPAITAGNSTVAAIPDATPSAPGAVLEIPFAVSGAAGAVGEVRLALYLTHTWLGDLDLTLVAPDGSTTSTLARLINGGDISASSGAALGTGCGAPATFADLGTLSIQAQTSADLPLTGTYVPLQPLDRFNGLAANGTWKLRIQDLGPGDAGSFRCGTISVSPFTPVTIAPTSASLFTGETITFTGAVNGTGPVNFTATGGTITSGGVYTAGNTPGAFTVTATDPGNAAQTAVASVGISAPVPVTFSSHPANASALVGQDATFSVVASGTGPLSYQWLRGGVAIPGATAPSYTTPALSLADSGAAFSCQVTGRLGAVTSNAATLTVHVAVSISPTSASLFAGDSATFTASVSGGGAVAFSATGGTVTATGVYTAGSAAGTFGVTATSVADPGQQAVASVTIALPVAVTFSTQPASVTAAKGRTATFTVVAAGTGPLAYQWKKGGAAIGGATAASYTTPALALADSGAVFTCDVTGKAGTATSNPATLTVQPAVSITPASASILSGDSQAFSATVFGGGAVTYTATGGTVSGAGLYTAGSTAGAFTVTANNAANPSESAVADVTIALPAPVSFTSHPAGLTAAAGHQATFEVVAAGSGPLAYQWKKGGVAVAGATGPSYTTPVLSLSDSRSVYTCEVTGRLGPATSNPARLVVRALGAATTASNTAGTPIPGATASAAGAVVEIPFQVSGVAGGVGEVQLALYLTHTRLGDLDLTLVAPDGSSVGLAHQINAGDLGAPSGAALGTGCGAAATISDLGAAAIQAQTSASLPLTGTYRPLQPLDKLNGKTANGTWKLRIQDLAFHEAGTYGCGALTVRPLAGPSLDVNADGKVDLRDLLFFAKQYGTTDAACDLDADGSVTDADLGVLDSGL